MNRSGRISSKENLRILMVGASALAMNLFAVAPISAQDVDTADEAVDEIVATGIRQSIIDAAAIKRNADTFVDAITASDIGALPDRSVSEALQRVPGVSIIRFAGPNDPDHFAVEGSGVVIRGLPFVRSELNGRDVFGASVGGVLGFDDVSPELLGSVQVFKNQSADLIEGGTAGTIDLRTRLPFDQDGQLFSYSLEANYGDLREEVSPSGSLLYSNNWETNAGRFGALFNISASELLSQADAVQISAYEPTTVNGQEVFIPAGGGIRSQEFDRNRTSVAGALQWESPDQKWLATAQFLRSDSTLQWGENVIETAADGSQGTRGGLDASDFVFDEDGVFQSGTITDNSQWRGPNATAARLGSTGGQQLNLFRERLEEDITNDFGFNLKYAPRDNLRFNFDAQYIDSSASVIDLTVHTSFFAPVRIDQSEGDRPTFTYLLPDGAEPGYFQDPSNYFIRSALDHFTDNDADSIAFRGDVEYDFSNDGWLKSVRAGVRYSDQDTDIRESDFNWGNISEVWTGADITGAAFGPNGSGDFNDVVSILSPGGNGNAALDSAVSGLFGGFTFNGGQFENSGLGGAIPTYVGPSVDDFDGFQEVVSNLFAAGGGPRFANPCGGPYDVLTRRTCTNGDSLIEGTPFLESEIGLLNRETIAAYLRVDFGTESLGDSGVSVDGNIGVRYVDTSRTITSQQRLPAFGSVFAPDQVELCDPATLAARQGAGEDINRPGFCDLDIAGLEAAFGDGGVTVTPFDVDYNYWLPSFNAKFDFGNDHLIRVGASRTLTRPDVNQINQRPGLGTLPDNNVPDPTSTTGFRGEFTSFSGTQSGNGLLLPQTSWNFDLSWEWYFSDTGSLTVNGFYKTIDDFIIDSPLPLIGPNGAPVQILGQGVQFNSQVNANENAELKGVEVAYQQFYDFLPGPLSGLGVQFNYAYIDADGVDPIIDESLPTDDPLIARFEVDRGIFPRVSEHNINAIGLYEKGPWQARVAYNWRSTFQVTPRDVIFPFASIYQPSTGQLDGSIFYDINENFKIGLQGVNLLNDITETTQSINEEGIRAPRSFFRNDRRFSAILRATF